MSQTVLEKVEDALKKLLSARQEFFDETIKLRKLESELNKKIGDFQAKITSQEQELNQVKGIVTALQAKNAEQDGVITALQAKNTEQDGIIAALQAKNAEQDGVITALQAKDTEQDKTIERWHIALVKASNTTMTTFKKNNIRIYED
jgi:co-chaperonin GroES (HSP10)